MNAESASFVQLAGLNKVYDPGCHCAFTDLTYWRGRVWLAFREALNHGIHPSSQIVVLASADHGHSFQLMARIAARGLDVRDPHFYVVDDRLHLTIPCWKNPPTDSAKGKRVTILARSDDGLAWELHREVPLLEDQTVWRPRKHPSENAWYAASYEREVARDAGRVRLIRTVDGLAWEAVSTIEDAGFPNETDLCFLPDGALLALVRREKAEGIPILARARAPYTEWSKTPCDRWFKGPLLERLPGGQLLAVGRVQREDDAKRYVTRMHLLDPETGVLAPSHTLESGNDTSYAALAHLPPGAGAPHNALLSYYSGHGYDNGSYRGGDAPQRCAIYVARLAV
ncbi:MAG: glycoside hydrolase [Planctomycetota bacterium]|nr:glycoside hydrolase [Planctomycetota bacterium]